MRSLICLVLVLLTGAARAESIQVLIGPPSIGQGGSNPVSIPPINPVDWQVSYINAAKQEWVVSVIPGLLWGQRFYLDQLYATLGGGLIITTSGLGVGVHHAIGYQSGVFWEHLRFEMEYRQVIGLANYGLQFPYTLRLGMSYAF